MKVDPTGLERFEYAQTTHIEAALAELRLGRKRTHWMWFVFPQLRGLGNSDLAIYYGVASLDEARRYLSHPILGPRLVECAEAVTASAASSLFELFGSPDDAKFLSSMTLFALVDTIEDNVFRRALARWNGGALDERTVELAAEFSY